MKTITICGKEHEISCNAYTRFEYKRIFNKGIFEDLEVIQEFSKKQEDVRKELQKLNKSEEEINEEISKIMMKNLDDFLDVIEKIAYIVIYTANNKIGTFQEFLTNIDKINLSDSWISEVTELAVSSFC